MSCQTKNFSVISAYKMYLLSFSGFHFFIVYVVTLPFVPSLRFPVLMTEEPESFSASMKLMEPEFALYRKTVYKHLQTEAQSYWEMRDNHGFKVQFSEHNQQVNGSDAVD
ncbi:hypothetical protein OIU76_027911 [Salix suchowensis]|nr:hypothetical protein OIU76_027911 [Salix suchowensis]